MTEVSTHKITCDCCQNDITTTGNCIGYRIALINQNRPSYSKSGVVTSAGAYPSLKQDYHFCNLPCLNKWFAECEVK